MTQKGMETEPSWPFAISLPSETTSLARLRAELDGWLRSEDVAERKRAAVVLATHEAFANAIGHARSRHPVLIRGRTSARTVLIEVCDRGEWLRHDPVNDERGRGLVLIKAVTHELEIETDGPGTTLRMAHALE